MKNYVFDGSYLGLLTAVFNCFEYKETVSKLEQSEMVVTSFFEEIRKIETDVFKAKRVQLGLLKRIGKDNAHLFYEVFLSEDVRAIQICFELIVRVFRGEERLLENFGDDSVVYFFQMHRHVSRERHRMKAFVRFQKGDNGIFHAVIAPDYNVLPLVASFFQKRYADQSWLIYDERRKYGLLYDKLHVREVTLSLVEANALSQQKRIELDADEHYFQQLWKSYFDSTNIKARKNTKLHLQSLPKRYWRYLPEKWDF